MIEWGKEMNFNVEMQAEQVDFQGTESPYFLLGLLSEFNNRYQAKADTFFEEVSWKQFFAIICIDLCKEPPTLKELSELMGSSHQNIKQILLKLESKGFVQMVSDEKDKRKQRIFLTDQTRTFCKEHDEGSTRIVSQIFEGIDSKDLETTIKTIIQMDRNLKGVKVE